MVEVCGGSSWYPPLFPSQLDAIVASNQMEMELRGLAEQHREVRLVHLCPEVQNVCVRRDECLLTILRIRLRRERKRERERETLFNYNSWNPDKEKKG